MKRKTNYINKTLGHIFLAAAAIFFLQISASAQFTVTTTADNCPGNPGNVCPGSLRAGLMSGEVSIQFNIPLSDPGCNPTTGICTITPQSNLPFVSGFKEVNGYTQPGASVNTLANGTNAVLKIEIRGTPGGVSRGFVLFGSQPIIKGLIINNFGSLAIEMNGGGTVVGSFIGTDASGTIAVPNGNNADHYAIFVSGNCNLIGVAPDRTIPMSNCDQIFNGTLPAALPADRNLISGNLGHGIGFPSTGGSGSPTNSNRILNNLIGTKADGASPLGNAVDGIIFRNRTSGDVHDNLIKNNVVAFNGGFGINIANGGVGTANPPIRNRIWENSIFSNNKIGINLGAFNGDVEPNDPCDVDTGNFASNGLQNYPLINSAAASNGNIFVNGSLNSNVNGTFKLQFFANEFCDFLTTKGEGKTYLGEVTVNDSNGDCNSNFNASLPIAPGAGKVITSTATDSSGNTSEFSGCMVAGAACTPSPVNQVSLYRAENNANDSKGANHGTLQNGTMFAPGLVGQAFSFDGVDDKVIIPDSPSLNFGTGGFTVETWAKLNTTSSPGGLQVILHKRSPSSPGWHLWAVGSVLRLDVVASVFGQSVTINSDTKIYSSDWFHVAFVVDRSTNTVRLYVNGVLQTAQPSIAGYPAFDDPSPFYFGGDHNPGNTFNGFLDETALYNRALSTEEIQSIYFAGGSGKCRPFAPPADQSVWITAGGDTSDFLGNNPNGILHGDLGFAVGKVGQALNFDGNGDYLEIPDDPDQRPAFNSITVEGWFKFNSVAGTQYLVSKPLRDSTYSSYAMYFNGGTLHVQHGTPTQADIIGLPFSPNIGEWYHIAYTIDDLNNLQTLYVNGSPLIAPQPTTLPLFYDGVHNAQTPHPLLFGATLQTNNLQDFFNGQQDEVTVYSRALSQLELQAIYNAGSIGKLKEKPAAPMLASLAGDKEESRDISAQLLPTTVQLAEATVTFAQITSAGTVSESGLNLASLTPLPSDVMPTGLAYDIATNATFNGGAVVCFHIPAITDADRFSRLRIMHLEGTTWINRTNSMSLNFLSKTICTSSLNSFSPFAIVEGLAPTSANVSVGGRVRSANGNGIGKARITMTAPNGSIRTAISNAFGYYRFDNVPVGETYIFSIQSKRYSFAPQVLFITEEMNNADFTAESP